MDKSIKNSNDVINMKKAYYLNLSLNQKFNDMISKYEYNSNEPNVLDDYICELENNKDYESDEKWADYFAFVETVSNKSKITLLNNNK